MTRPPSVRRRFDLPWRTRGRVAADVDDELRFHLEETAAALCAAGWSGDDAEAEARRRFGDVQYTFDYCRREDIRHERERHRMTILEELSQDFRYAMRTLRKAPGFAAAALITLALGIGANTAIFSVVRGVLLEPLPFAEAERVMRVWHAQRADGIDKGLVSEPDFLDWREQSRLARSLGGFFFADGLSGVNLTGSGDPERLSAALVTDGFFETLATPAVVGRTFVPDEHVEGRDRVVVLSHGFWTRRFGADSSVLGRTVTLEGDAFEVIGVMPEGFTYPAGRTLDVWIPLSYFGPDQIGRVRAARFLGVVARLQPGATEGQFRAELASIASRLSREHPENAGWNDVSVMSIRDSIVGEVRRPLIILMSAVALLLLIACVNLASLLLARATARQPELAVRAALGAGRGRIARQLMTESLTLALIGGAMGVGLGLLAGRALATAGANELPRATEIGVDGTVLVFTLVVSIAAGLLFGLMPAMRASSEIERALRSGSRGGVGAAGQKLRSGLVVAEVAIAVVLVVGAGLAVKSFARLLSVDPGFRPDGALVATISVPSSRYSTPAARAQYYYEVLEGIRRIPGVVAAGASKDLPLRGHGELVRPDIPGRADTPGEGATLQLHQVSTDFFRAVGTPLLDGRTFEMTDGGGQPPVIVVNEEMARRTWPGESALGKMIRFGQTDIPVIGVVGNVRQRGLTEPVDPTVYLHVLQNFRSRMSIVVRTTGDPRHFAASVRQAIWAVDPEQTITSVEMLDSLLGEAVARPRLLAWLLALFGMMGLVLGAVGIFGVLAYAVNQRRQEIGVRVALGASPRAVLASVVRQGMLLAALGVVVGVLVASLLTRWMQGVLYGIEPTDPATFVQVGLVLLAVALLACWLPARRALKIDPVAALRYE